MHKKLTVLILLTILLTACIPATPTPTEEPVQTEVPVPAAGAGPVTEPPAPDGDAGPATQEPIETEAPVETEEPALSEAEGPPTEIPPTEKPELVCAKLLTPENGFEVPAVGKVTFAWEPVEGAGNYILRFTLPGGEIVEFETDQTTKERYMEAFGTSGEFEWNVIAFGVNNDEICISESALFTKPGAQKQQNGDNGGSSSGYEDPPPPIVEPEG